MAQSTARKTMTFGEGGTALVFAVTALLCLAAAARAEDAPFAFHAYLSAAASVLAVFMIFASYSRRPSEPIPAEIDGKPKQFRAGQVCHRRSDVLGHRRFRGGTVGVAGARLAGAQFRSALSLRARLAGAGEWKS